MFFGPELPSNHGYKQIRPDASGKVLHRFAQSRIKRIQSQLKTILSASTNTTQTKIKASETETDHA